MTKLAIIDDDQEILTLLDDYLAKNGFEVEGFTDGESYLSRDETEFDLLILDIGLPGIDGLEICRRLRQKSSIPIIMLTAASDDLDRILGLELGADDYLGKPFNPRELLARIKALLRRMHIDTEGQSPDQQIEINYAARKASIARIELDLTCAEFDMLGVFHKQIGTVLSRDKISELLHRRRIEPFDRSIDTSVSRLRQKLSDHLEGEIIQSVRGKGYEFLLKK